MPKDLRRRNRNALPDKQRSLPLDPTSDHSGLRHICASTGALDLHQSLSRLPSQRCMSP